MKAELGKIYKFTGKNFYCYFAKYTGKGSCMAEVSGGFMLFNQDDILQILCEKDQKPVSNISEDEFKNEKFEGNIIGAGDEEDIDGLFKSSLEDDK